MQMHDTTSSETKKIKRARLAELELAGKPPQTALLVRRGLTIRETKGGILVPRLHYSVAPSRDPELNPQWKLAERKVYTSQASWDREMEIVDQAGGGELVFADTLVTYWKKIVIEDPRWQPDPEWTVQGGGDHGKTNPTAIERAYVDFEGTIIFAGEYYQPGKEVWQHTPEIKRMPDFKRMDPCYFDPTAFDMTLQRSQRAGQAAERAKSIAELYQEAGIEVFSPFAGDRSDVSFAARLQLHWADLENREPTVKIDCRNYSETPQFGLHPWDCPNLLWELMRARRQKLSAQQLLIRNTSEAILDKDNHARDAMKYMVMSHPEPAQKSLERRVSERVAVIREKAVEPNSDAAATMAVLQCQKIMREEEAEEMDEPFYYGGNARRIIQRLERRRRLGWGR